MLVFCLKDGLTAGQKVMMRGEVFRLPEQLLKECENLSDEQLAKFNRRTYGEQVFRRPTPDELVRAWQRNKKFINESATKKEKDLIFRVAQTLKIRQKQELEARLQIEMTDDVSADEINDIAKETEVKEEGEKKD